MLPEFQSLHPANETLGPTAKHCSGVHADTKHHNTRTRREGQSAATWGKGQHLHYLLIHRRSSIKSLFTGNRVFLLENMGYQRCDRGSFWRFLAFKMLCYGLHIESSITDFIKSPERPHFPFQCFRQIFFLVLHFFLFRQSHHLFLADLPSQ